MIIYKISSPYAFAFVGTYADACKSMAMSYPDVECKWPLESELTVKTKIFSRMGSGWFQIEAIEVLDFPQRLMPYVKV